MPTIEERKFELKQKRSDALMAKLKVLMARDGSEAPPIDSMKEEDDFNLALLFGQSRNENIAWSAMGVEGLIRCYYEIIYKLNGKIRNNIIKLGRYSGDPSATHNSTVRSGLLGAVDWLGDGQGYRSGFYIGWNGLDTEANDEGNATKKQRLNNALSMGRRGDMDVPMTDGWSSLASKLGKPNVSTSFTDNRDPQLLYNSQRRRLEWVYPENQRSGSLLGAMDSLIAVIGNDSSRGPHNISLNWGQSEPGWSKYTNNTLLGRRHRDVAPYEYNAPGRDKEYETVTTTDPDTGQPSSEQVWTGGYNYTLGGVLYGDGDWDDVGDVPYPPGYTPSPDYWTGDYEVKCNTIISKINDVINYIGFTRITNFTYFVNYLIIPGIDPSYDPSDPNSTIGSSWNLQNGWIADLEAIRDRIQQSIDYIGARKENSSKTLTSKRNEVDAEITTMRGLLNNWLEDITSLGNTMDGLFGSINDPLSLWGHRFMWIRTLIHATEGTMTAVNATGMAIDIMNKKLAKAEEELLMFGLLQSKWIPTPIIVGIEPYPVLNQTTFETEIGGWLVAWGGQEHCTGYDVWKSEDYDPATKSGTWQKLEVSNTNYTMTDIDANTGKVLTYIIDGDVEPIPNDVDPATVTHPYYKVKAYDINGGSGDYDRQDAQSEECEPQNPAAFPFGAGEQVGVSGPRRTPIDRVTTTDAGSAIPPNTLFWITSHKGIMALDFERTIYTSEAPFDSTGSNLIVFVDGKFKNQGLTEDQGDYSLVDTYTIKFNESIAQESEVNIVVGLRSFAAGKKNIKGSVSGYDDLPDDAEAGDIYFAEEPAPGQYYQWVDPPGEWQAIDDPNASSTWRDSVNTFSQLPTQLNADGDVRLVLDTSTLYRWDGGAAAWVKISGAAGGGWLSPVDTLDDLEDINSSELSSGAIIFVVEEGSLYRWDPNTNSWLKVTGSGSASWKDPVNNFNQLPDSGNSEGDIRLVLDENRLYRWFAWEQEWKMAKASADLKHEELTEDDWESVDEHDARYYPKTDLDVVHNDLAQRLSILESLKPQDADDLSGDFATTGTKLYRGYLSEGLGLLRFDTLQPQDYFTGIIKDPSFILSNNNPNSFNNGDKGILRCYINDVEVDTFDLGEAFNEDERSEGQSYPRRFGQMNIIEILSVEPYNSYPAYQRADFQIHISQSLLVQGENKIVLEHEVQNQSNDIHTTEPFFVFWDEFDGSMGFKDIYVEQVELNSNKYLSGVRYYSMGDVLRIRFEAENLFNNTYVRDEQIQIESSDFAITPTSYNYEDDEIQGNPLPQINEDLYFISEFNIDVPGVYSAKPELILKGKNPFKTYSQTKNNTNFLINTVTSHSTTIREDFYDENFRLPVGNYDTPPAVVTGNWDSSQTLTNSDLQLFGGELVYPSQDFSNYYPSQSIDYSTFAGPKQYLRSFSDGQPRSNGIFYIKDFHSRDPNIKVEIKLPGLTGWLSLNDMYNAPAFGGQDGDGAVVKNSGERYEWTSGEFSTANSGYMVILRITLYQTTQKISFIELDW